MNTMKKITKITTAAIAFLMISLASFAQNKITIVGGIHSANISASGINVDFLDIQTINRFTGGLTFERKLDKYLSFKTGLIYKQKGFKLNETTNVDVFDIALPVGVKVTSELNTIDIPLLLKLGFDNTSNVTPYIAVGPNFSYAMSGVIKTKATAILDFTLTNTPINLDSDNYNRLGIEGMIAGGISFPYGRGEITTEINYSHALNNFTSDSFIVDTGIRNRGVGFTVGYAMKF
jgi:hypothetical protein